MMATLTRTQIENAVRTFAVAATGAEVIIARPDAPRPSRPYVTIELRGVKSIGHDEGGSIDDDGIRSMRGDRVASISVNAYGDGAMDLAESVRAGCWRESTRSQLVAAGMVPISPGQINDLSQLLETDDEERSQLDLDCAFDAEYVDDTGFIETVVGEETVDSLGPFEFTATVSE